MTAPRPENQRPCMNMNEAETRFNISEPASAVETSWRGVGRDVQRGILFTGAK